MKGLIRNIIMKLPFFKKKRLRTFFMVIGILVMISFSFTACNKTSQSEENQSENDKEGNNKDEVKDILEADRPKDETVDDATDAMSEEDDSISEVEDSQVNGESAFDEQQHPFTFEDLYHNVYTGTIGNENVIVDLYPNMEDNTVKIRYLGANHADKVELIAQYPNEYSIIYSDKNLGLYLCEFEDGIISGTYYDKDGASNTQKSLPINLKLSHINYMADPDIFYTVGTNEEIETFAKKMKEVVATNDIKALASLISYPISLKNNEEVQINNQVDFIELEVNSVFTPELKEAINNAFPAFMFCNAEGIMLGNGEYNIWFSYTEDGRCNVIAINN